MRYAIFSLTVSLLCGCAMEPVATTPATKPATAAAQVDTSKIMMQADLAYKDGDLTTAEQAYRLVIEQTPDNATAQYRLGNTLVRAHHYDAAIAAYKASLVQDANREQAYSNLAALYMLQAQSVLSSGIEHLAADDGNTAQIKHMLWQLKKATPARLQDVGAQWQPRISK